MKKLSGMIFIWMMVWGVVGAEAKEVGFWNKLRHSRGIEIKGKEVWRRELGQERSLLLYMDEEENLQICFTDGPWVYLTEELGERLKAAGIMRWEREGNEMKIN